MLSVFSLLLCLQSDVCKKFPKQSLNTFVLDCRMTPSGKEYAGLINKTKSGYTCQRWDRQFPHRHHYRNKDTYPENNITMSENYCRNPDVFELGGPWCYTTNPRIRWEYCDIPMCGKTSKNLLYQSFGIFFPGYSDERGSKKYY